MGLGLSRFFPFLTGEGLGLGLTRFIPLFIYCAAILLIFISIFGNPKIGILFLFPLLPYQNIFEKLKVFPLGKDLNDLIILSITIGWILKREQSKLGSQKIGLNLPIVLLSIVSLIGLINGSFSFGISLDFSNPYLVDWKNYMLFPVIWLLTANNIKDKKTMMYLVILMVIGILGADYYFRSNLKWMNIWHFSEKARNQMTGLFVYLGANHYGAFFAHFVFILIGFFIFEKKKIKKLVLLGIISLTIYCIIYSFSRGAYIALLLGLFFIGLAKERKIIVLLIVFLIFWRTFVPISVTERIDMTKNEEGQLEESSAKRVELWGIAWQMFQESPILGKGFNTFRTYTEWDTHNFYMKTLAELGILGLIAFLWLCLFAFISGWKLYKESKDNFFKGLGLGFSACVISVMVTNAFGDRWSYLPLGAYFWVFFGLVTRARIINKAELATAKINNK